MSLTFYPAKFKMREDGSYEPLPAIRGEPGQDGTTGPAGRGVGEGTFAPIVLIQAAEPSDPVENLMWIENTDTVTVGEVMVGVDTTLPTTKPDGTALSAGDVYVMNGNRNNHPVVWGNVTIFPLRVWLYSGSAWASVTAKVYVNSQWYPTACEWIVENGKLVGYFGVGTWATLTERDGYLELSVLYNSSTPTYTLMPVGRWAEGYTASKYPRKYVLEGTVRSRGQVYLGLSTSSGPGSQSTNPSNFSGYSYSGTTSVTLYDISSSMMTTSSGAHGIFCVKSNTDGAQITEIKNLYIVYGGDVPNVGA